MKKLFLILQIISVIILFLSKILLLVEEVWGWWIAIGGYILVAIYNYFKANLKIYTFVGISLAALSGYAGYKWIALLKGLGAFDYCVIGLTILFTIFLAIQGFNKSKRDKEEEIAKGIKKEKSLWGIQTIGTFIFMTTFLILGWGYVWGWLGMFAGHVVNTYVYYLKRSRWYVVLQIASGILALLKIFYPEFFEIAKQFLLNL